MSRQFGLAVALLLGLTAFALLLALPSWAKEGPAHPQRTVVGQHAVLPYIVTRQTTGAESGILLEEDFEHDGAFPPQGWVVYTQSVDGWTVVKNIYSRGWSAYVPEVNNVNEVLVSSYMAVNAMPAQVTFWARRANLTHQTLTLWVVLGEWDAGTDDDEILVSDVITDLQSTNWTELSYAILPSYTGSIRLAWQYASADAHEFYLDDILLEVQQPEFIPPHSHVIVPYKVEPGDAMTYVLVLSNTGKLPATAAVVRDELPPGVSHVGGTASWSALGSGVISSTFTDTAGVVEWAGSIPTATGLLITIPVDIIGGTGDTISNVVTIYDPAAVTTFTLVAQTQVYPTSTLAYYESFNAGPGDDWQGNEDWEWGRPLGPLNSPHSWPAAWGTDLDGSYFRGPDHILTATLSLAGYPLTNTCLLQWWEWFERHSEGADVGLVKINGVTVYEVDVNRTEWTERLLNISDYAGQEISVTFVLDASSVGQANAAGWYIDDVAVHVLPLAARFDGSYKRVDRSKVAPAGSLTYTFYITNSGYATSTQGRMYDVLPPGLQVRNVYSTGKGSVTFGNDYVEWSTTELDSMPIGTDAAITVVVDVLSQTLACGTSLLNSTVVTDAEGYGETSLQAPAVSVYPGDIRYASLFETDDGGLAQQGDVWEWGETVAYGDGPAWDGQPAHSAPRVWGTVLDGNVTDTSAAVYTLTLVVDLADAGQLPLAFQWWDWYEPGDDEGHAGSVLISSTLSPTPEIYYVQGEQGMGWQHHSVEVSDFAGHSDVHISFIYATDGFAPSGPGWYIDSVALHDACPRLFLRPESQVGAACRGFTATFQLDVFNWDNTPTQVDLSLSGGDWPSGVAPVSLTVPAAATETVVITVAVPEIGATSDTLLITASADNGLVAAAVITTSAADTAYWQGMASLPERRAFHAVVALDGALYAIGGSRDAAGAQPVSTTFRYDPASDSWEEKRGMPVPLSHIDAVEVDGEIYVPGGRVVGGAYTNTLYIYSPTGDNWQAVAASESEVSPVVGYGTVAYNGQLVRLGGYLSLTLVTTRVWVYDPNSSAWTTMTAMQEPRADFAAGVSGGRIYVAGGFDGSVFITTTEEYDDDIGVWNYVTSVPTSGAFDRWVRPGDAVLNGWLYLVGGERSDTALDHSASYSPTTSAWNEYPYLPLLNQPRRDLEADVVADKVYAVGGRDAAGTQLYDANERLVFCPVCNGLTGVSFEIDFEPLFDESDPVDGQTITFTASYDPPIASKPIEFVWDWGDGTPGGSGRETTHVYTGILTDHVDFEVVVTGTNCAGSVMRLDPVKVRSYPVYSMSVSADIVIREGEPGVTVTHIVNVYNLGNRWDSYTVTLSGGLWTPEFVFPTNNVLPVGPGQQMPVIVEVVVPSGVEKGEHDSFTVTIASPRDTDLVRNLVLTTIYPDDDYAIFLPLVLKQDH